jgi:hypothetical protein
MSTKSAGRNIMTDGELKTEWKKQETDLKNKKKIKGGDGAWIIQNDWMSYKENIKMGKSAEMFEVLHLNR